jgi:penicillin G amidase
MSRLAHARRLAASALLALAALGTGGCALSAYLGYQMSPDYPVPETETLRLPGLEAPVEVLFDPQGVPHLRAKSERDLALATGFVQARERFFEMDMIRRIARGRVSALVGDQPLLGSTTVEFDLAMRGWGLDEAADADAAAVDPEAGALLAAFAAGVNAAVARKTPLEYRLLGLAPEPWLPSDTFAVGRLTAWSVTHNWSQELSRLLLALHQGPDRAELLYPARPWDGGVSVPLTGEVRALPPSIVPEVRALLPPGPGALPPAADPHPAEQAAWLPSPGAFGLGSNAFAVGGARTRSGKPLLASDPHLSHLLPSMMMQMQLACPDFDVIGISVPGLPYVLIGHSPQVAWGMTSAVADVVDFYLEQVDPADPGRVRTPAGYQPLTRREVVIQVRDGDQLQPRTFVLRASRNGPIIQDMYPGKLPASAPPVALHQEPGSMVDSLARLRRSQSAKSAGELRALLAGVAAPSSVYTVADVQGGVELFACGHIPVRERHLGTFPVPGWLDEYQWKRFATPEELPALVGGADALVGHANNLVWEPARAAVPFHIDSAPSYRLDRIVELLRATPKHDPSTFARIQRDVKMKRAERVLPFMLEDLLILSPRSELEDEALGLLIAWDLEATTGSPAPTLFFETYRLAGLAALSDELPAPQREFVLQQRYSTHMLDVWFFDPEHPVWDDLSTPRRESRREVVQAAFQQAVAGLSERFGPEPASWAWGRVHYLELHHPFGGKAALADLVNLPRHPMPGALDTVWKAHFDIGDSREPYRVVAGPVFRMLADLQDLGRGLWILDTGASGWPGSPHYADQHARWLRGEYVPMLSDWRELGRRARGVLTLAPGGE